MERDSLAIDGLLRELSRARSGYDEAFVARVMARTRPRSGHRPALIFAAAALVAMAVSFLYAPEAPSGRLSPGGPGCLVSGAQGLRVLVREPASGRLLLLGESPLDVPLRVPAETPLLLQAVGRDGLALWTSPQWTRVPAAPPGPGKRLGLAGARSVDFRRDVKPILDRHCSGCHAESDLVCSAKPFAARRSPLLTQTHQPLTEVERRELALWIDLGAARP